MVNGMRPAERIVMRISARCQNRLKIF